MLAFLWLQVSFHVQEGGRSRATYVWLLSCVGSPMDVEVRLLREPFQAPWKVTDVLLGVGPPLPQPVGHASAWRTSLVFIRRRVVVSLERRRVCRGVRLRRLGVRLAPNPLLGRPDDVVRFSVGLDSAHNSVDVSREGCLVVGVYGSVGSDGTRYLW